MTDNNQQPFVAKPSIEKAIDEEIRSNFERFKLTSKPKSGQMFMHKPTGKKVVVLSVNDNLVVIRNLDTQVYSTVDLNLWNEYYTPYLQSSDTKDNAVNHPQHYNQGKYECIDVMEEVYGKDAVKDFCLLNAFKYVWRCRNKDKELEDADKAVWYLNKYEELGKEVKE